jgi:GGDEF domain-containing protein
VIEQSAAPPEDSTDESPYGKSDVEPALSEWWQQNPDRSRQLLLAKIEIDHFEQVAAKFGEATDLMMQAISDLVSRHVGVGRVRPSETSYVIMFPEMAAADVTTSVEQIRREIEHTQWQHGEKTSRVTASCAVVEALTDDTDKMLLERVEATLSEAERYGHNRTYLHEGGQPAPVEPPNLIVTDQTVSLAEAEPHEGLDASHE